MNAGIAMPQKALDDNHPPLTTITARLKNKSFTIILILLNILITLSLLSFDMRDGSHVTGTTDSFVVHNWIGALGARFSFYTLLSIGLAAYPAVILLFICTLRHLFGLTHTANWIYVGGYTLTVLGFAMIFGCYPEFMAELCATLNLKEIPGGAFGSTLCHPEFGWLKYILNTIGCTILASTMILIGLITIWLYDWRHYSQKLWQEVNTETTPVKVKKVDLQKNETKQPTNESRSQLHDTASNVITKVNSVFSWMKVRPGRQLNTIERIGVEDQKEDELKASETEVVPAIADSQQALSYESTQIEVDAPEVPKPLLLKKEATPEEDNFEDVPGILDEEEPAFQEEESTNNIQKEIAHKPDMTEYVDPGEAEPLPDIINDTDLDAPVIRQPTTTYKTPTCGIINKVNEQITVDEDEINRKREILQETLDSFRIKALTGNATPGPRVTLFEIIPEKGVKVEKIANLNNNIAMELQAEKVRILAPIPGRRSVGIEVPNDESSPVCYRSLLESKEFQNSKAMLPVILGKDISGKPIIMDLAKAPHLLIAGATGAGKSVFMNTLILSLLFKFNPDDLQMIMVDPKFVELTGYNTIPHLICPVITDPQRVPSALRWAVFEMDCRYQILASVGVKNLEAFNNRVKKPDEPGFDSEGNKIPDKLPTTIIIIDELADLMMMAKKDVETSIARIAQKARAVGIHLVIATQRPSVDVVTGVIKANFPTRIAFKVSSNVDSKTILDRKGAEELLGMGDMLFMPPGSSNIMRIQGAWVKDQDIETVVTHCAGQQQQNFIDIFKSDEDEQESMEQGELFPEETFSNGDEELIHKAIEIIKRDRRASTSHIQRRLRIGYNRAAIVMEALEERGIVGPQVGSAKREIYLDRIDSGDE